MLLINQSHLHHGKAFPQNVAPVVDEQGNLVVVQIEFPILSKRIMAVHSEILVNNTEMVAIEVVTRRTDDQWHCHFSRYYYFILGRQKSWEDLTNTQRQKILEKTISRISAPQPGQHRLEVRELAKKFQRVGIDKRNAYRLACNVCDGNSNISR